jgi:hypothetical protein
MPIMKSHVAKPVVAVGLGMGVWAGLLAWYPFPISLAWPGFVLARMGVQHGWVLAALCVLGLLAGIGLWARGRAWWQGVVVSLLVSSAYGAIAFLYVARLPVPLPTVTPYDSSAIHRKEYLEAYDGGFRDGMMGALRTYCFRPESETRGAEDGALAGMRLWFRMSGRELPSWLEGSTGGNEPRNP